MHICVLTTSPGPGDLAYDPSPYLADYRWMRYHVRPGDLEAQIRALMSQGVDVFLNLVDGTPDDEVPGAALVQALEACNAAFTGAHAAFFDPTRAEMKSAAYRASVPTPRWMMVSSINEAETIAGRMNFPLLVKPPHGYSSVGIHRDSRVTNLTELHARLERALAEFGGVLVEEFIEGREFTCLVAEDPDRPDRPRTFTPVEFHFPAGETFKHYEMKWVEYQKMTVSVVTDPEMDQVLRQHTAAVFQALDGSGYARCDYRMDQHGNILMLEINPNCAIFYPVSDPGSADYSLLNDPTADHHTFLKMILHAAQRRQARRSTVTRPILGDSPLANLAG